MKNDEEEIVKRILRELEYKMIYEDSLKYSLDYLANKYRYLPSEINQMIVDYKFRLNGGKL